MNGFPPKELDTSNSEQILQEMSIRSGDTLIIEENKILPKVVAEEPKLVRR